MWMHEEAVLFTGAVRTTRDPRYSLKSGDESTLVIDPVSEADNGKFACRIMLEEELQLVHEIVVSAAFVVRPVGVHTQTHTPLSHVICICISISNMY